MRTSRCPNVVAASLLRTSLMITTCLLISSSVPARGEELAYQEERSALAVSSGGFGPEIPIYGTVNGQYSPCVAYNDSHGEYLVVWQNDSGSGYDIYGRRLSEDGNMPNAFAITSDTMNRIPDVAYDPALDRYLVVYSKGSSTFGRFVPWGGPTSSLPEFPISSGGGSAVAYGKICARYLVATESVGGISVNLLPGDGSSIGPSLTLTSSGTSPAVAYNQARDEFLVTWTVYGSTSGTVQAVILDSDGNPMHGGTFTVSQLPSEMAYDSKVAACHTADQYLIAWDQEILGAGQSPIAQRVSGARQLLGTGLVLDPLWLGSLWVGVTCVQARQQYVVAWNNADTIEERGIASTGYLSPPQEVGTTPSISGGPPAVAVGATTILTVWTKQWSVFDEDIYGRLWTYFIFADDFESGTLGAWSSSSP